LRIHDDVNSLRVQIAAETLKLRRKQHGIGVVDLQRGVPPAGPTATHGLMGVLHLVEFGGAYGALMDEGR
jgi:hypothetical protein